VSVEGYQRVLRELCEALGLPDGAGLEQSRHLELGETVVGLLHDADATPDTLFLYFDLGPISGDRRERVHEAMLRSNLRPDAEAFGHFGLHPVTSHAAWLVRIRGLDTLRGADLASFLATQIAGLQGWMDRVLEPLRETAA
jgi:hypothetical protein